MLEPGVHFVRALCWWPRTATLVSPLLWPVFLFPLVTGAQVKNDDAPIRIGSQLVLVPVSVTDRAGRGVAGLKKESFKVFDNGVEQEITDFDTPGEPITVALVIDISDSAKMSLAEMRKAASLFIDKLESRDKALIYAFDKQTRRVLGPTSDREMLRLGLAGIGNGGGTALYDTVEHVLMRSFVGVSGRKAIVLLTDGIDTSSARMTFETSANVVVASAIPIFPIQFPPEDTVAKRLSSDNSGMGAAIYTTPTGEPISSAYQRGTRYLRLIADSSGGRFQFSDTPKSLESAFSKIAAELRQLYYLGFYPIKDAAKAEKRKLSVKVAVPDVRIEARESYIARP